MNTGQTVFAQVMDSLPHWEFRKCVKRYQGDYKLQKFSCMDQFLCMAFAQLTYRESLRDIEVDFARLYVMHQSLAFFVTRAKRGFKFKRRYSHPVDKSTGLRSDQTIILTGVDSAKDYPEPPRRIHYYDAETEKHLIFLTNNFLLPAIIIAQLYKARWRVELFFKWIKQHLRIKRFYGTSENAVKTQIWIAVSVYVLVAIIKKELGLDQSLYTILQFLSVSIFENPPVLQAFSGGEPQIGNGPSCIQLTLFDL